MQGFFRAISRSGGASQIPGTSSREPLKIAAKERVLEDNVRYVGSEPIHRSHYIRRSQDKARVSL